MIERFVKMSFRADEAEAFIRIFEYMEPHILAMPGCSSVRLLRDTAQPNVFFTHSIWQTAADLDAYRASDRFRNTWAQVKTMFDAKPKAWSLGVCMPEN